MRADAEIVMSTLVPCAAAWRAPGAYYLYDRRAVRCQSNCEQLARLIQAPPLSARTSLIVHSSYYFGTVCLRQWSGLDNKRSFARWRTSRRIEASWGGTNRSVPIRNGPWCVFCAEGARRCVILLIWRSWSWQHSVRHVGRKSVWQYSARR